MGKEKKVHFSKAPNITLFPFVGYNEIHSCVIFIRWPWLGLTVGDFIWFSDSGWIALAQWVFSRIDIPIYFTSELEWWEKGKAKKGERKREKDKFGCPGKLWYGYGCMGPWRPFSCLPASAFPCGGGGGDSDGDGAGWLAWLHFDVIFGAILHQPSQREKCETRKDSSTPRRRGEEEESQFNSIKLWVSII